MRDSAIGPTQRQETPEPDSSSLESADRTLIDTCCDWPVAGPRFYSLWRGEWRDWPEFYPSQSEADSGFIYMLAGPSWDMDQIKRIFMASGLGWRLRTGQKKKHADYIPNMINAAFRDVKKVSPAKIELDGEWKRARANQETNVPQVQIETVPLQLVSTSTAPLVALYPKYISSAAYIGLPGEFVKAMMDDDMTEADPNILLVNFLQMAGVMVGHGPRLFVTPGVYDHANLFTVNVGKTSKARKGTSQANTEDIYEPVDPQFAYRIRRDVSTGDGIVHLVRDPKVHPTDPKKSDPGEPDKRLFLLIEEFSSVFAQMRRAGNNISEVLRQAYDGKNLTNSSKTNQQRATKPHIAAQGHITIDELTAQAEIGTLIDNGFANRFLWLCSTRSKELPFTKQWDAAKKIAFQQRLNKVINAASTVQEVVYSPEAFALYASIYKAQAESESALDQRSTANMRRLGMVYALLDESQVGNPHKRVMSVQHLEAAQEIIRYAVDSAKFIFTGQKTNADAERICNVIAYNMDQNKQTSKTEIYREFRNHRTNAEIDALLTQLINAGRIAVGVVSTQGRNKYVYVLKE